MILIDSSAWIEFLRDTGSRACQRVDELMGSPVATCDAVRMEVLAGARSDQHLHNLRRLLAGAVVVETEPQDYDHAAALYRTCRRHGRTVRKMLDCLIAAHALRANIPLLHWDADFDALARHTGLIVDDGGRAPSPA